MNIDIAVTVFPTLKVAFSQPLYSKIGFTKEHISKDKYENVFPKIFIFKVWFLTLCLLKGKENT